MRRDFYAVLGLQRTASEEQIRQRFRELARERHPDRFQGERKAAAELEFQEITQAANVLADTERRRQHDLELARPQDQSADHRQLGRLFLQRGVKAYKEQNFLEAAESFDRATQAEPTNAKYWHHLALASSRSSRWYPRALAAIARACELEPMNPAYLKLAGRIAALCGRAEDAQRYYEQAIEWGGDEPAVRQALEELRRTERRDRPGLFGKGV
ncbi:MAG TPA: DnaJ domain-containing protein [Thermoanaerobaculia bacterium]|nr:DnaJ domain-containing protein [Thermoanaerobaculia bacterium]